jgi:hypothetical protein
MGNLKSKKNPKTQEIQNPNPNPKSEFLDF